MSSTQVLMALFTIVLFASSVLAQKIAVQGLSPLMMGLMRVLLMTPLVLIHGKWPAQALKLWGVGLFWVIGNFIFLGLGFKSHLPVSASALLIQTNVLISILMAALLLKERPSKSQLLGIIVACLGVMHLSEGSLSHLMTHPGILYFLGASCCWSLGYVLMKKFSLGQTLHDQVWVHVLSLPGMMVALFLVEDVSLVWGTLISLPLTTWAWVSLAAIGSSYIGSALWMRLGHQMTASALMPFMLLLPIFSSVLGYLVLKEVPTERIMESGLFILGGVALTQKVVLEWLQRFNPLARRHA